MEAKTSAQKWEDLNYYLEFGKCLLARNIRIDHLLFFEAPSEFNTNLWSQFSISIIYILKLNKQDAKS